MARDRRGRVKEGKKTELKQDLSGKKLNAMRTVCAHNF